MNETGRALNWFSPARFGVLLALLVFATFPQVVLGVQTFVVRDFGYFAYPLAAFQRECFWHGQLPFWNPYNECGVPFLAQWNTMPLYPPALFYLVFPLQWSLGVFCLLHLWFAGFGMYRLARHWTQNDFAAAFAGTAFAFNGLTLNLLMWPSHIATLSWMPWVILAVQAAWRDGGKKIFSAAIVGAMQLLAGGPETILLTWLVIGTLWLRHFIKGDADRTTVFWSFPTIILLVTSLAAVQLIPFIDLAAHSQRAPGYADMRWSMPAWGWANFLVPMAFGTTWNSGVFFQYTQSWTSSYYLGIAPLLLAVIAAWRVRRPFVRLFAIIAVAALVLALGDHTFVLPTLRKILPATGLVTYPIKFTLLPAFLVPLLAAFSLAEIQKKDFTRSFVSSTLVFLTLIAGILFWAVRYPIATDDVHATLLNGIVRIAFLLLAGILLVNITGDRPAPKFATLLLVIAAWLDVLTHEPAQNPTAPPSIYSPDFVRQKLQLSPAADPGQARVMPTPSAFLRFAHHAIRDPGKNFLVARADCEADCNLLDHIPKVDGFFSLLPGEWSDVRGLLYSRPDESLAGLENFLGVSQITATNDISQWQTRSHFLPLVTIGQQPVFMADSNTMAALADPAFDGARTVILSPDQQAQVATADRSTSRAEPGAARITRVEVALDKIDADTEADRPAIVVIAQTWFHRWHGYVDGRPGPLLRANHAFQAIEVPAGSHHVELVYHDRGFVIGAIVSLATLVTCLAMLLSSRQKKLTKT